MSTITTLALIIGTGLPSMAYDLRDLKPGSYVNKEATCDDLGSAADMSFDGRNFAGHYQICQSQDLGNGKIRNTCVEHQGPNPPSPEAAAKDPDAESADIPVKVLSPSEFQYGRDTYKFCSRN